MCSMATSGGNYAFAGGSIRNTGWQLLAMSWDGSTLRTYVDGVRSGSAGTTGTLSLWPIAFAGN